MPVSDSFRIFALEQLQRAGPVTARAMFGGVGLYHRGVFFALMDDDRLYFKVDDVTQPEFEAAGMEPFRPYQDERVMPYYEVPGHVLEDVELLAAWMTAAVGAARRRRSKRR